MKKCFYFPSLLILLIGFFFFQSCTQEVPEKDDPVVLSSEKSILSYSVKIDDESYEGKIDSEKREITISNVPYECDITNLKPIFNISDKAKISINEKQQTSGVSSVDFSKPVIYLVTAEDGSKAEWTVKLLKEEKTKYTLILHMNYPESEKSYDIPIHKLENETITLPKLPLAEDNFSLEEDYTFLGWSKKENAEEADYWSYVVYTVRCDTELWGVWKKYTANYTVNVYKQNLNDSYSDEPDETITGKGVIGTHIEYDVSKYEGFTLDKSKNKGALIGADGKSVLNVYLMRKNIPYKVNYYMETLEGSYSDTPDDVKTMSGKFEAKAEYDLSSFPEFFVNEDKTKSVTISADGSTVFNVYLKRGNISYKVNYYKETVEGTYSDTPDEVKTMSGKFGAVAEYDISSYSEFFLDVDKTEIVTISADGSTVVNVYLKRRTFLYKVNYYKETLEGSYSDTPDDVKTMSGKFGAVAEYDLSSYFGYYLDFSKTESVTISADGSTVFNVYLKRGNISYKVKYYKETLEGSYSYTPDEVKTLSGKIGGPAKYDVSSYQGFFVDTDKIESVNISADGSTVVNVYLKRKTISYKVNYYKETLEGSYSNTPDEVKTMSGKFGAIAEYDVSSYLGFYVDENKTKSVTLSAEDSTVVNVYLERRIISYKVNLYKESLKGFYFNTPDEVKTLYGKFGETAEYDVSSYNGFSVDTDKIESVTISTDRSTVVNVYLKRKTISYKVNYYKETLEGAYSNTPDEVKTMTGKFGSTVEYDISSYTEFVIDENKTKSLTIFVDGSTSFNVYMKRKIASYTVKYFKANTDGTYADTEDDVVTASGKVGAVIVFNSNKYVGFEIDTEKTNAENVKIKDDNSTVLNVYYSRKQINYLVKHFVEDADSNSYNLDISESKTGNYGAEMEYQVKDLGEHISFEKVEYSSSDKTVSEGSYVNVYYKLSTVTFTYKWNMTGEADTVKTFKYGQSVTKPSVEERVLYSFDGWSPSVPETATENKDFEAHWTYLVDTTSSNAPIFIKALPDTIYVKKPVSESSVSLSVYTKNNNSNTYYSLYKSTDGIIWSKTKTSYVGGGDSYNPLSMPITIGQDNGDAYYCMSVSSSSNGPCSYSNVCRIITNPDETENIGSYYYSDGSYSVDRIDGKTVVGIVVSLKEDKSPKMIIPVDFTNSNSKVNFTTAKQNCESYSQNNISDWKLPDFIELESVLFNTSVINDSLNTINSSLRIQTGESYDDFYWADNESGDSTKFSLTVYPTPIPDEHYCVMEKSVTMKGYYLPVKILE